MLENDSKTGEQSTIELDQINDSLVGKLETLVLEEGQRVNNRQKGLKTYFAKLAFKYGIFNEKKREFFKRKPLFGYSLKRIGFALITFYVSIAIVYLMMSSVITNSTLMQNHEMKEFSSTGGIGGTQYMKVLAETKKRFGLDVPLVIQVLNWWLNISFLIPISYVDGSYVHRWFYLGAILSTKISVEGADVLSTIKTAIPVSFEIGFIGFLAAYVIGIPLGIACAKYKGKGADKTINLVAVFLQATPGIIVVSIIFVLAISVGGASATYSTGGFSTKIYAFITMFLLVIPQIIIDVRRYVVDEMTADYTKFAKSKGLKESYIFTVHVFRVAGVRVLRIIPTALILSLFGSSILTETYWNIDGMSKFILNGVTYRDLYVCLGYIAISSLFGILTSLLADLITAKLDPRVSLIK